MKTPTISHCLALTLPLWAAALGWSTATLASGDTRLPAVEFALTAPTTVADQAALDLRLPDAGGATGIDLKIDGEWTATDGDIVDLLAANSPLLTVTSRFEPASGDEQRMRFKVHGSPTWGPWTAWTSSRIAHTTAVPGPGQMNVGEFEASARPIGAGTPVIAVHGYVKIKKLNTGG